MNNWCLQPCAKIVEWTVFWIFKGCKGYPGGGSVKAQSLTTTAQKTGKSIVIEPRSKKNYAQEVAFIKRDFKKHKDLPLLKDIRRMEVRAVAIAQ